MNSKKDLIGKKVMKDLIIEEYIGSGGFGDVYKAYSLLDEKKLYCAVKHIVIPRESEYEDRLTSMKNDRYATDEYFRLLYKDVLNEINLMYQLSGKSRNIVAYQHYDIDGPKGDPKQYEIFIKMEYLTSLDRYCVSKDMTVKEVINMGIDIASAIEVCHREDIMHRDIKASNIFINEDGVFKLGDFGLAKKLTESAHAKSKVGTDAYKAPEVFNPYGKYDKTVDIYSLGIVLYEIFNNGRLPFMPDYPKTYGPKEVEEAIGRRVRGGIPPKPAMAPWNVSECILKACAPNPKDRYQTAGEFKMALMLLLRDLSSQELSREVSKVVQDHEVHDEDSKNTEKSYIFNDSFGKYDKSDEDYKHVNIFDSSDGKRKMDINGDRKNDTAFQKASDDEDLHDVINENDGDDIEVFDREPHPDVSGFYTEEKEGTESRKAKKHTSGAWEMVKAIFFFLIIITMLLIGISLADRSSHNSMVSGASSNHVKAKAISAGTNNIAVLKEDGNVVIWGDNSYDQCNTPLGLKGVKVISAGYSHIAALNEDGTVSAWGTNASGQCSIPYDVIGVKDVAAGGNHTVVLMEDGTVRAFGDNSYGQCNIPAGLKDVKSITAGAYFTAALRNDGTVVAWGYNGNGQCNLPSGLKHVKAISAGGYYMLFLMEGGTIAAWGNNDFNQCSVPLGLIGVKDIAAGYAHAIALLEDGTVVAWGDNSKDQCNLPNGLKGVKGIAAGFSNTAVLMDNGSVMILGANNSGQCDVPSEFR